MCRIQFYHEMQAGRLTFSPYLFLTYSARPSPLQLTLGSISAYPCPYIITPALSSHFLCRSLTSLRALAGESSPSAFLTGANSSSLIVQNSPNLSHSSKTSKQKSQNFMPLFQTGFTLSPVLQSQHLIFFSARWYFLLIFLITSSEVVIFSRNAVDMKVVARFPWQYFKSPFMSLTLVSSTGNSLYSFILTLPSTSTCSPTFYSGQAFLTQVETMSRLFFIIYPAQVGSATLASTLSTDIMQVYFTPFFFMCSNAPLSFISQQMAPFPPGAKHRLPYDSMMILPLQSRAGIPPWGKKHMAAESQPKQ